MTLERLNGESRYGYRGWIIRKVVRDWDARGYRGSTGNSTPKVTWEAKRRGARHWVPEIFWTRRDAIAYIDAVSA